MKDITVMNLNQSLMTIAGMLQALDHFADETTGMHKDAEILKHCTHAELNLTAAVAQLGGLIAKGEM